MTKPDYLGAAAWCETEVQARHGIYDGDVFADMTHATLALRCVRAMAALRARKVMLDEPDEDVGEWSARINDDRSHWVWSPDPLTAITMALTEAGDA